MPIKENTKSKVTFTIKCSTGHEAYLDEDTMAHILNACYYQSKTSYKILKPFLDMCIKKDDTKEPL